jgi:hypothetical protein
MKTPTRPQFTAHGLRFTPHPFQRAIIELADRAQRTPTEVYDHFLKFIRKTRRGTR